MAAFRSTGGPSFQHSQSFQVQEGNFDIFEWYPKFQSCVRYFQDHAQYSLPVQAVAAFVNIQLPFQSASAPNRQASAGGPASPSSARSSGNLHSAAHPPPSYVTLLPYVRRLVATGFDDPAVLHGFFGDDWADGIGPLHEAERRNFLFAAKSDNWSTVKASYDMDDGQTVPFLRPLQNVSEKEILNAEVSWSEWLAMQDWMLGPRAPGDVGGSGGSLRGRRVNIKREED